MKTHYIDSNGIRRPIHAIKMTASGDPSGLRVNRSEAEARYRLRETQHAQRVRSALDAGLSHDAARLSDELNERAYRLMSERGLSFSDAMKATVTAHPRLARAYGKAMNQPNAGVPSTMPMAYHCANCDTRLTRESMAEDQQTAACPNCKTVHELDEPTAAALSGTVRIGRQQPLDEAGGDADLLDEMPRADVVHAIKGRNRAGLDADDPDSLQPHTEDGESVSSRDHDGEPRVLTEIFRKIRREQRRRLFSAKPVL